MYLKVAENLFEIKLKCNKYAESLLDSCVALEPLEWYVCTSRCSNEFYKAIANLTSRQMTTIAKRLLKHLRGDYMDAINDVKAYLKVE